jgi:hypothetical protein
VTVDNPDVAVLLLVLVGLVLVADLGSVRSRASRRKAEQDASMRGWVGEWINGGADADALARRYDLAGIVGGWTFVAVAVGLFLFLHR